MKFKNILGILIVVGLIVAVSGCTSVENNSTSQKNEKVIGEYNLTTDNVKDVDIPIPDGTNKIRIEYSNLNSIGGYNGNFDFYTLNVTRQSGQPMSSYVDSIVDTKSVMMNSTTPYTGTLELNANNAKSVVIVDALGKGNVKVIAIERS